MNGDIAMIGAGLAAMGVIGPGIGIGILTGMSTSAMGRNPDAAPYLKKDGMSGWDALLAFQEASGAFVYSFPADPLTNRLTATTDALTGILQPEGQATDAGCLHIYLPLILR